MGPTLSFRRFSGTAGDIHLAIATPAVGRESEDRALGPIGHDPSGFILDRSALDRVTMLRQRPGLGQGAAMDRRGRLRTLGLERYEATFRENDVDAELLSNLTS